MNMPQFTHRGDLPFGPRPWQPKGLGQVSHVEGQVRFDVAGGGILTLGLSTHYT